MSDALRVMGFTVEIDEPARRITISGAAGRSRRMAATSLSGRRHVMRFLCAMVTLGEGRFVSTAISGCVNVRSARSSRDAATGRECIQRAQQQLSAVIVDASRARFEGGETSVDARASSQFVSAMLMPRDLEGRPQAPRIGDTARPFIDMTLRLMEVWGAHSTAEGEMIAVPGGQWYRAQRFVVEPDASSASYFAAPRLGCGTVRIEGLTSSSVQGDLGFLGVLQQMGARVCASRPRRGRGKQGAHRRRCRDEFDAGHGRDARGDCAVRVVATIIRNVAFIRHHESDRIRALATELGAGRDRRRERRRLEIAPSAIHPAAIETYDDHRIAMSFGDGSETRRREDQGSRMRCENLPDSSIASQHWAPDRHSSKVKTNPERFVLASSIFRHAVIHRSVSRRDGRYHAGARRQLGKSGACRIDCLACGVQASAQFGGSLPCARVDPSERCAGEPGRAVDVARTGRGEVSTSARRDANRLMIIAIAWCVATFRSIHRTGSRAPRHRLLWATIFDIPLMASSC